MLETNPAPMLDCEHCGTVSRALTLWPETIHRSCPCACHRIRNEHNAQVDAKRARSKAGTTTRKARTP